MALNWKAAKNTFAERTQSAGDLKSEVLAAVRDYFAPVRAVVTLFSRKPPRPAAHAADAKPPIDPA